MPQHLSKEEFLTLQNLRKNKNIIQKFDKGNSIVIAVKLIASDNISEETRRSLKSVGTRSGIMYGLCKVHKDIINNCPPFRPILSAINTPTYKLAEFLVPILKSLTSNEYTVKGSFAFAREIVE